MAKRELTSHQHDVLQWIGDGCPDNDWPVHRYKQSARMLAGYGLVKITGHSSTWKATITDRGTLVLSGEEDLVPQKKRGKTDSHIRTPTTPPSLKTSPPSPRRRVLDDLGIAEAVDGLFQQLIAAEFHIVANLPLDAADGEDAIPDWKRIAERLRAHSSTREGDWRVSTRTRAIGQWPQKQRQVLDVALVPEDRWLTESPEEVTSRERIGRYHPAVTTVMEYATNISSPLKPRARRLLHALFREIEARGWKPGEVSTSLYSGYRTSRERGSLQSRDTGYGFSDGHHSYFVCVTEDVDRVERPPTKEELRWHESTLRWSPNATLRKFYEHRPNGRLIVTIGSRQAKDTKRWAAETALTRTFNAMSLAWAWDEYDTVMKRRAEERWQKKLAIAEAQADGVIRNRSFHQSLEDRATAWETYRRSAAYVNALRSHLSTTELPSTGALEWLSWCEEHLAEKDPFRGVGLPDVTPPSHTERSTLVNRLARKVPDTDIE